MPTRGLATGTSAFVIALGIACTSNDASVTNVPIMGGAPSSAHGAVGRVEHTVNLPGGPVTVLCTGTLIAPDVVLTAAQCVDWNDHPHLGNDLIRFTLDGQSPVGVTAHRTLGSDAASPDSSGMFDLNGDVALLYLDTALTSVAPLAIASTAPSVGDALTVVGYGCTSRATMTGGGSKMIGSFTYGTPPRFACAGDFGGPLLDGSGAVLGVLSGHGAGTMTDFFGNARALAATISTLIASYPAPFDPHAQAYVDVGPSSPIFHHANVLRYIGVETDGSLAPDATIARADMARWIVRAAFGETPHGQPSGWWEPPTPSFGDVPLGHPQRRYIERMWALRITNGCDASPNYCPNDATTRGQFAAFLAHAMNGPSQPPPLADVFSDVPQGYLFAPEIAFLQRASALTLCGPDAYCPDAPITRGDAARMIVQAFFSELLAVTPPSPTVNPHFAAAYAYLRGTGLSSNDSNVRHALRSFCTNSCSLVPTMFGAVSDPTLRSYCQAVNGGSCNLIMRTDRAREDLAYFCGRPTSCNNIMNADLRSLCLGDAWCDTITNPDLKSYCYGLRDPRQCETINDYVLRNVCSGNCDSNAF